MVDHGVTELQPMIVVVMIMNHYCSCNTILLVRGWSMVIPYEVIPHGPWGHRGFRSTATLCLDQGSRSVTLTGFVTSWSSFCAEFAARQQDGYAWTETAMPMATFAKQRRAEDYRVFGRRNTEGKSKFQDICLSVTFWNKNKIW